MIKAIPRERVWEILDAGKSDDITSRIVDVSLIVLISLNVLAVILESVESYGRAYATWFYVFEVVSVLVFSVEYGARLWSVVDCPDTAKYHDPLWGRIRFMLTPMALIDLAVILPFYLAMFLGIDLRFMRVLRLLRIFKLTRYSASLALLASVFRREAQSIGASLFVLLLLIIIAASLTYIVEHDVQPEAFGSIPAAMWWAVVTMTTVGYGDVIPMTNFGKFFAVCISILSMGLVATPAALLASGFIEALRERRERFADMVEYALGDGVIDEKEEMLLQRMRTRLGMSKEEADLILRRSRRDNERQRAGTEFVSKVKEAYSDQPVSPADWEAIEDVCLALGIESDEAQACMNIFQKHWRQQSCPHCGEILQADDDDGQAKLAKST